jgi:hypothetical protein
MADGDRLGLAAAAVDISVPAKVLDHIDPQYDQL